MPLPSLIELEPPPAGIQARVQVPGSKSITNRALVLAALGSGTTRLERALWSEDTRVMVTCLRELGFHIEVGAGEGDATNRTILVRGRGGELGAGGSEGQPLELYVANSGTTARFLTALVCLGRGAYRLTGTPRMHERPQRSLFQALRQLGYRVEGDQGDTLPVTVWGAGPRTGSCDVSIARSSQLASALLLAATRGGWTVRTVDEDTEQAAYVRMTRLMCEAFPQNGGDFEVEIDASGGSYFAGACHLLPTSRIEVAHWPSSDWQIDAAFMRYLPLPARLSRHRDLGDSIMTAIVMAPFAPQPVEFLDLGRLRVQECERVQALRNELTKCGARVTETGDTLRVEPSALEGAEIETYDDHRMAMCFAMLGLRVGGMRLRDPSCVRKTYPTFFRTLAAPPPDGLGVVVRDATSGRALPSTELLAE